MYTIVTRGYYTPTSIDTPGFVLTYDCTGVFQGPNHVALWLICLSGPIACSFFQYNAMPSVIQNADMDTGPLDLERIRASFFQPEYSGMWTGRRGRTRRGRRGRGRSTRQPAFSEPRAVVPNPNVRWPIQYEWDEWAFFVDLMLAHNMYLLDGFIWHHARLRLVGGFEDSAPTFDDKLAVRVKEIEGIKFN